MKSGDVKVEVYHAPGDFPARRSSNTDTGNNIADDHQKTYTTTTRMKPIIRLGIRFGVGASMLAALIAWIGLEPLRTALTRFHPAWYAAALACILMEFSIQSLSLSRLVAAKGILVRARHVLRLKLISVLFGVFLPGGVGPDIILCYNMVRGADKKEVALSAVVFVRISVLFLMAVTAWLLSFHPLAAHMGLQYVAGLFVLTFLVYAFVMVNRHTLHLVRRLFDFLNRRR